MRSDRDPSLEPVPDDPRDDARDDLAELPTRATTGPVSRTEDVPLYASAEEVAYAAELAALDRAEDAALRAEWAEAGYDVPGLDATGVDVPGLDGAGFEVPV
ncbi:MAG: hypothetical protein M0Z98_02235, partial [Actinomycetales bacterium]|nr:hypothetical protein [Actinomycetales bacterium]